MFFSKKRLDNREKSKNITKIASFSFEKKLRKGGQSGKNPTIWGDLYDQGGSKNRGFHNAQWVVLVQKRTFLGFGEGSYR